MCVYTRVYVHTYMCVFVFACVCELLMSCACVYSAYLFQIFLDTVSEPLMNHQVPLLIMGPIISTRPPILSEGVGGGMDAQETMVQNSTTI